MIANAAFYLGLARALACESKDGTGGLAFDDAVANFYAAARHGLDARLTWPGVGAIDAASLLLERVIPMMRDAGIPDDAIAKMTDENPARWFRGQPAS